MPLSPAEAVKLRDRLVKSFAGEAETTLRVVKAISPEKLAFKPHPKSMGLGELAWHLIVVENWFVDGIGASTTASTIAGS